MPKFSYKILDYDTKTRNLSVLFKTDDPKVKKPDKVVAIAAKGIKSTGVKVVLEKELNWQRNKMRLENLDKINQIDKRLKMKKIKENPEETSKLMAKRNMIRQKLKTKK